MLLLQFQQIPLIEKVHLIIRRRCRLIDATGEIGVARADRLAAFEYGMGGTAGDATVGENGEGGDADADEAGGDFCGTVGGLA